MKQAKVPSHKRKGRTVKTHTRKIKGVGVKPAKPGSGSEIAAKKAGSKMKKGSAAAKAHMANLRSMRKS